MLREGARSETHICIRVQIDSWAWCRRFLVECEVHNVVKVPTSHLYVGCILTRASGTDSFLEATKKKHSGKPYNLAVEFRSDILFCPKSC